MLQTTSVKPEHPEHIARETAGFTLIEMLVVVLMIGVLSAIAVPGWLAFVNTQQLNAANDRIYNSIRSAQAEALKQKLSYSVSFQYSNNVPQIAIYRTLKDDGTYATPSGWTNLVGDGEPITIGTNISNENTGTTSVTYGSAPVFSATSRPQTITFDYTGSLTGQSTSFGNKGLIVAVAVADLKRCVIVKTLLGEMQTQRDSDCN
jgi:prepilin-type N-terminal cleavage/methylation domain-containing protein